MSDVRISGRAPLRMIEAYWEGLRNGRLLPNRSEVQARGLGAALDNAFVLERVVNGFARLRVAGHVLNDLQGMETRGMPVSALFEPDARATLSDSLEAMFSEPATVHMTLKSPRRLGQRSLSAEMILMPLRSDLGDVTRALGCLIFDGKIGAAPRRFLIETEERHTLTGFAEASELHQIAPRRVAEPVSAGFAEAAAPFDAPRPARVAGERPYLRLVQSDEG